MLAGALARGGDEGCAGEASWPQLLQVASFGGGLAAQLYRHFRTYGTSPHVGGMLCSSGALEAVGGGGACGGAFVAVLLGVRPCIRARYAPLVPASPLAVAAQCSLQ